MALLLNIDTATGYAGVCLSKDSKVLASQSHQHQKDHAAFLQPAIEAILKEAGCKLNDIDAVAVTAGPGSYTGIRVGLASAKGICYALNKPLIMVNTLAVIANAAIQNTPQTEIEKDTVFYAMIDARRMEVFAGMYNQQLLELANAGALVLDSVFFEGLNCHSKVIFCGDGAKKVEQFTLPDNYSIDNAQHTVNHMVTISESFFNAKNFSNLAYSEPLYIKDFYQPIKPQ
ncbi:MAG TPA: tRNA (adenosine(37)-N6)-threonylcarbamoyltransferase complex dimerization subunit type 1 TsaB [Sediminibacterium sp.]|jgi:tRNA threonylcarbamoyladenosine biosynthesis protein TsaB|nr:tRNA (adenosine(37)-N6)-threonylcarbamoyltransferase complex dimerization subunit type 1 TsaB [Sediminibacterium sp.]